MTLFVWPKSRWKKDHSCCTTINSFTTRFDSSHYPCHQFCCMHETNHGQVSWQRWSSGVFGCAGYAPITVIRLGLWARVGMVTFLWCISRRAAIGSQGSRSSHSAPEKKCSIGLYVYVEIKSTLPSSIHVCAFALFNTAGYLLDFLQKLAVLAKRENR